MRPPRTTYQRIAGLAAFGAAVAVAALLGVLAVTGTQPQYASLARPRWAPSAGVLGPVWSVLYVMIAVAEWLVWRERGLGVATAVFAVQLVLNAVWTPIFFGAGAYGWALVDIIALWLAIAVTVAFFWRVSRPAALLLLPYWVWVSFATALNIAIWRAN